MATSYAQKLNAWRRRRQLILACLAGGQSAVSLAKQFKITRQMVYKLAAKAGNGGKPGK